MRKRATMRDMRKRTTMRDMRKRTTMRDEKPQPAAGAPAVPGEPAVADVRGARTAAAFVAAFALAIACYQVVPGDTLAGACVQGALLAAVALVACVLTGSGVRKRTRAKRSVHSGDAEQETRAVRLTCANAKRREGGAHWEGGASACASIESGADVARESRLAARGCGRRGVLPALFVLLAIACASGAAACALAVASAGVTLPSGAELARRILLAAALCLVTGVFEEGLFRVLAIEALEAAWTPARTATLRAAFASAALFGLMHTTLPATGLEGAAAAIAWAQLACKVLQAFLFGLIMAALYVRLRSLAACAGVHAAYDALALGPLLVAAGAPATTYATGSPADLALLAATTLAFVPLAVGGVRTLRSHA